jgi:hypothetical protein
MKVVRNEDGMHSCFLSQLGLGHQRRWIVFFAGEKCSDFGHANFLWSLVLAFPSPVSANQE